MMCREKCCKSWIGWDFGGRDFSVVSAFDPENKRFDVIWPSDDASGSNPTASASKSVKISKNSADSAFGVAQCVAECGPNPGGFSCD